MKFVGSKLCMLKDLGMNENLFGGNMMAWMDELAAIFAHKTTKERKMVTLKFGEIIFKRPVKLGDIVDFYCLNEVIGKTSISFNLIAKIDENEVFSTTAVFVAVDENGNKKEIGK